MALTNTAIKNAKPKEKQWRLPDGGGLHLLIHPNGSKYWRFKYRYNGKEKLLALGVYPDVTLKRAREKHQEARRQLELGNDPSLIKKAEKRAGKEAASNSFEAIGNEWFEKQKHRWSPVHQTKVEWMLSKNLNPWLGHRPIAEITAPELLSVLRRIESRE